MGYEFTNKVKDSDNPSRIGAIGMTYINIAPIKPIFPLEFHDLEFLMEDELVFNAKYYFRTTFADPEDQYNEFEIRVTTLDLKTQFAAVIATIVDETELNTTLTTLVNVWLSSVAIDDALRVVTVRINSAEFRAILVSNCPSNRYVVTTQDWAADEFVPADRSDAYYPHSYNKLSCVIPGGGGNFTTPGGLNLRELQAAWIANGAFPNNRLVISADCPLFTVRYELEELGHMNIQNPSPGGLVIPVPHWVSFNINIDREGMFPLRPHDYSTDTLVVGGLPTHIDYEVIDDFFLAFTPSYEATLPTLFSGGGKKLYKRKAANDYDSLKPKIVGPAPMAMDPNPGTSDYILQIICNEVNPSLLAGGGGARILKVVPVDPLAGPQVIYTTPVTYEWKQTRDGEINSLSFFLANGSGDPHPFFVPGVGDMNAVIGLKLDYISAA